MTNSSNKVVFFDIDGTIVNQHNQISKSTRNTIKALRKNGIKTGLATGRSGRETLEFKTRHGIMDDFDLIIYANGGIAEYNGEILFRHPIDPAEVAAIIDIAKREGIVYGVGSENNWRMSVQHHPAMEIIMGGELLTLDTICDPDYYKKVPIHAGVMFTDMSKLPLFSPALKQCEIVQGILIGGKISPHIDFWRKDITKASAIKEVLHLLDVDMENCYGVGDGFNDIQMLEEVGIGIAMGNAHPDVQKHAKFVTKHIDDNGIEYAMRHFGLIE